MMSNILIDNKIKEITLHEDFQLISCREELTNCLNGIKKVHASLIKKIKSEIPKKELLYIIDRYNTQIGSLFFIETQRLKKFLDQWNWNNVGESLQNELIAHLRRENVFQEEYLIEICCENFFRLHGIPKKIISLKENGEKTIFYSNIFPKIQYSILNLLKNKREFEEMRDMQGNIISNFMSDYRKSKQEQ